MPILSTYSVTGLDYLTYCSEFSTLDELLTQVPDNNRNIIKAIHIRDLIYTLWNKTTSSDVYFLNNEPTTVSVGGIDAGTTFSEPMYMQDMWNMLLYPYIEPIIDINITPSVLEYGDLDGLSINYLELNWSVVKKTNTIESIIVDGVLVENDIYSGVMNATGTHSWNTNDISQFNNFNIEVNDGKNIITKNTKLTWLNNIYWGYIDLNNVNLTYNPQYIIDVINICTDEAILALDGAGVGNGKELSITKSKKFNDINGNGKHLIFAWPSAFNNSKTPIFKTNGFINTAFTCVRTDSSFENKNGFTTKYEVWVSNTIQNSPISTFEII